jgi:hypothetical protein
MKKTLFLHLGQGKTGSTAIQHFLSSNDELLLSKGYHYIRTLRDKGGAHHPLAFMLFHKRYHTLPLRAGGRYVRQRDELLRAFSDEIAASVSPSIILSSEAFLHITPEPVYDLLDLFSRISPGIGVKGIVYIRSTTKRFLSQAAQTIKYSDTDTNDERLCGMGRRLADGLTEFKQGLDAFAARVGKKNLIFRKYGKSYFEGNTIFSDILGALGVEFTDEYNLPQRLINKSLESCETLYFKDVLNRLKLKTSEETIVEQLFEWEESNEARPFCFPMSIRSHIETEAAGYRRYMLENYLTPDFEEVLDEGKGLKQNTDFVLSHQRFLEMLDYVDSRIEGFRCDYMEAVLEALDSAYLYDLHLNEIGKQLKVLIEGKKCAFWGCGDIAEKLFEKFDLRFLEDALFCVVDADVGKHSSLFRGHEIAPLSKISANGIDTVITATVQYADEITREIRENFPNVRSVINLGALRGEIEVVDLNTISSRD